MKYRLLKGYKYELLDTVTVDTDILYLHQISIHIALFENGRLFIKPHYAWDGPSFLTIDTKTAMRGSLVHDAMYQLIREGLLDQKHRKRADELLRDICIEDGMWPARAKMWYWFVRKFGKKSSLPRKNPRGRIVEI